MSIRNLFPDRIAMRLDEPEQVDMVLGDGARDRSAHADLISSDPAPVAGTNLRELMVRMGHSSTRAALIYLFSRRTSGNGRSPTRSAPWRPGS